MSNRSKIREIFLANGFTKKPGLSDLKPYVYEAAEALLESEFTALRAENEALKEENKKLGLLAHANVEIFENQAKGAEGFRQMFLTERAAVIELQKRAADLQEENERLRHDLEGYMDMCSSIASEKEALKKRVAELEADLAEEALLNKYAVISPSGAVQHVYSRVNADAYSVYSSLVEYHGYNPDISVRFVSCEFKEPANEG